MTKPEDMLLAVKRQRLDPATERVVLTLLQETLWTRPTARELAHHLHRNELVVCWSCFGNPKAGDWCYDFAVSIIEDIP